MDISDEETTTDSIQTFLNRLFTGEGLTTGMRITPILTRSIAQAQAQVQAQAPAPAPTIVQLPWAERKLLLPKAAIRLFDDPQSTLPSLWDTDYTFTEWNTMMEQKSRTADERAFIQQLFATNQRKRWLARVVQLKWTQRVWRKRTQCNVDMLEMSPIAEADALFMTDTTHRQIFRFHRRDVFTNMLSNICLSDEMLPTPRAPTNPWNNLPLTLAQTMGLCTQLVSDFAKRGKCPPVLFSAFWAARFNLKRFQSENSALLSQHAIQAYFKDLDPRNMNVVEDTIMNLLSSAVLDYSATAVRRWLRQTPRTPLHKEWLEMARDYTLYMNLHVQARPHWHSEDRIYTDVVRLYNRTQLPDPLSTRIRSLRTAVALPATTAAATTAAATVDALLGLSLLMPTSLLDISGSNATPADAAIQLIQNAMFRY